MMIANMRNRELKLMKPMHLVCMLTAVSCTFAAVQAEETLTLVLNPYADVNWDTVTRHKTNLHTHTTESDGVFTPAEIIDKYRKLGYTMLAITDHDKATYPWHDHGHNAEDMCMVAIPGNELSRHHHTLGLFAPIETTTRDWEAALEDVRDVDGLAVIAHPAMHWRKHWSFNLGKRHGAALRIPMEPAIRKLPVGDFALETWFRTENQGRNILLGNYKGKRGCSLNLELHSRNRVRIFVSPDDHKQTVDLNVSADTLNINTRDGQWHHLVATREGDMVRLYLDGKRADEAKDTAGDFELRGDVYFIGRDTRTQSGTTWFVGDLASMRLWNRSLSSQEVAQLAQGIQPGDASGPKRDQLIAEYVMNQQSVLTDPNAPQTILRITDTAGHAQGPFHATSQIAGNPAAAKVPADHVTPGQPTESLQFAAVDLDAFSRGAGVPEAVADFYTDKIRKHDHIVGVEWINGTRSLGEHGLDRQLWDMILMRTMPHRPVWGFSNDDTHTQVHLGRDWTVVLTEAHDLEHARRAIEQGTFFSASMRIHEADQGSAEHAPIIHRIDHDPQAGTLTIIATENDKPFPAEQCHWIADNKIVHKGTTLNYRQTPGIQNYVRAELRGQSALMATNPFGFQLAK